MVDEIKDVDKTIAFILEFIFGFFGILGIGYFYAGDNTNGLVRLIGWMVFLMFSYFFISLTTMILIGFCLIPGMIVFQVLIPLLSALMLKSTLEKLYPES